MSEGEMTELMKKMREGRESALRSKSKQKQKKPRPMQVLLHTPMSNDQADSVVSFKAKQPYVLSSKDMVKSPVAAAV